MTRTPVQEEKQNGKKWEKLKARKRWEKKGKKKPSDVYPSLLKKLNY